MSGTDDVICAYGPATACPVLLWYVPLRHRTWCFQAVPCWASYATISCRIYHLRIQRAIGQQVDRR
eukprot:2195644-Rhodomonas_salina.1